jgi:F-type H+-transporting ATPase subunit a
LQLDRLFNGSAQFILRVSSEGSSHGEGEGGGIATHLDNIGSILDNVFGEHIFFTAEHKGSWVDPLYFWLIAIALVIIAVVGYGKRDKIPRTRLQSFLEIVVDGFTNMTTDILGPRGKIFTAYIGTLFVFILIMNLFGMVPLGHSPTTSLNVTVAMAICTFLLVQFHGLRQNGFLGYLKHLRGDPWWLAPLNLPLHIIGEFAKPFSLSIRLFGNITGEDTLIAVMIALSALIFSAIFEATGFLPLPIPLQFPFYFLGILGSLIQALVFSVLSAVYISLMMAHGNDEDH